MPYALFVGPEADDPDAAGSAVAGVATAGAGPLCGLCGLCGLDGLDGLDGRAIHSRFGDDPRGVEGSGPLESGAKEGASDAYRAASSLRWGGRSPARRVGLVRWVWLGAYIGSASPRLIIDTVAGAVPSSAQWLWLRLRSAIRASTAASSLGVGGAAPEAATAWHRFRWRRAADVDARGSPEKVHPQPGRRHPTERWGVVAPRRILRGIVLPCVYSSKRVVTPRSAGVSASENRFR